MRTTAASRCCPEPRSSLTRLALALGAVLAAILPGAIALADTAIVEPTAAQVELVEQGVEAGVAGDHAHAIELFQGALELGELNILWLNLGRAQARLEQCRAADDAYTQALLAPPVASPDADEVHEIIGRYRQELAELCTGTLELSCSPDELAVSIDGATSVSCAQANGTVLSWGQHEVTWRARDGLHRTAFEIEPDETTALSLDADAPAQTDASAPGWIEPVGWSSLALGAVLVIGGAVVDTAVADSTLDDLHEALDERDIGRARDLSDDLATEESAATGLYIGGAALTALGVGLIVAHYAMRPSSQASDEGDGEAASSMVTPWVAPGDGGGGVSWRVRW